LESQAHQRKVARGQHWEQPDADWGEILYVLGKVYNYKFDDILEMRLSIIFTYYEWAVYDFSYEVFLRQSMMGM
jgi:hypothetical protein